MAQIYFTIGAVIGGIFALGCTFLALCDNQAFNKILNKNNQSMLSHATIILIAALINVLVWPIIAGSLIKLIWKKFSTPQQPL